MALPNDTAPLGAQKHDGSDAEGLLKPFRVSATAAAALALGQVALGSWVRINGAGMTCPDWPLCHGALVPQLIGSVVLEWIHRLIALTVGIAILAAMVTGWRARRAIAAVAPTLLALVGVFVLQVIVGGVTIRESNSPPSVVLHWACAMLLLAILAVLAVLAREAPRPGAGLPSIRSGASVLGLACVTLLAYLTTCIGAYVSSSGAGLACSAIFTCNGSLIGMSPPQWAQMLHRAAAVFFVLSACIAAVYIARSGMPRVRAWVLTGTGLALLQVALGISNVLARMPELLRETHAANAALTFIAFVIATWLAMLDPLPARSKAQQTSLEGSVPLGETRPTPANF